MKMDSDNKVMIIFIIATVIIFCVSLYMVHLNNTKYNGMYLIKNKTNKEVAIKNIDTNKFNILTKNDLPLFHNIKNFNVGDTIIIDKNAAIKY